MAANREKETIRDRLIVRTSVVGIVTNLCLVAFKMLVGLMAMGLFWQLAGALIYQNHLIVLLGMTAHIMLIVSFEAIFHRYREDPDAGSQRRLFYQISVWLVALFPCSAVTRVVLSFWPRPYLHIWDRLSPFLLYLPLCLAVTLLLRRKR